MTALYSKVDILAGTVRQTPAAFRKASYDSKPLRILLATLLCLFIDQCPLAALYHLAIGLDPTLHDKCFRLVGERLDSLLWSGMMLACKDKEGFVSLLQAFVSPVLFKD